MIVFFLSIKVVINKKNLINLTLYIKIKLVNRYTKIFEQNIKNYKIKKKILKLIYMLIIEKLKY